MSVNLAFVSCKTKVWKKNRSVISSNDFPFSVTQALSLSFSVYLVNGLSPLLTFSQILPLEKMKQLEVPLVWKLPMAPAGSTPWPEA